MQEIHGLLDHIGLHSGTDGCLRFRLLSKEIPLGDLTDRFDKLLIRAVGPGLVSLLRRFITLSQLLNIAYEALSVEHLRQLMVDSIE